MKFRITFKDPDGVSYGTDNAIEDVDFAVEGLVKDLLSKYIKYDEYITIEFDLIHGTAEVVKVTHA